MKLKPYPEIVFGDNDSKELRKAALHRAWEVRNFEIELYWKRALYFWGFIAVCFGGYFNGIDKVDGGGFQSLLLGLSGFVFSVAWFLVNKASKFWQENWEAHVDCLESEFEGSIYKTVMVNKADILHLLKGYHFSVSKINQLCNLFVIIVWVVLIVRNLFFIVKSLTNLWAVILVATVLAVTILFVFCLFRYCQSSFSEKSEKYDIKNCKYRYITRLITKETEGDVT